MVKKLLQSTLVAVCLLFASGAFANKVSGSLKVESKPISGDSLKVKPDISIFSFFLIQPAKKDSVPVRKEAATKQNTSK